MTAASRAKDFYDATAEGWDARVGDESDYWTRSKRTIVEAVAPRLSPEACCLDVGCAGGHLSALLSERGHEVWATDLSERMVEAAGQRIGADRVAQCAADSLPYPRRTHSISSPA